MTLTKSKEPKIARSSRTGADVVAAAPKKAVAETLVLGGVPRVHLLPSEVLDRKKARAMRRKLAVVLVVVLVAIAAGVGLASVLLVGAQSSLTSAQTEAANLAHQRSQYGAVTQVQADAKAIQASQTLATATEIDWQPYLVKVGKTLPGGTHIQAITASIDPPVTGTDVSTDPLQGTRVATVEVTVISPQASIAGWLVKLPSLPGFVDAEPKSVSINSTDSGGYTVVVDIHVNSDALSGRFATAK